MLRKLMIAALAVTALCGAVKAATVTFTWTPPATRTDGSALAATAIAGADIYDNFGCTTTPCLSPNGTVIGSVAGALGTFKTGALAPGAHTFVVVTRDTSTPAVSSAPSNAVTLTIVIPPPAAITNLSGAIGP